MPFGSLTSEFWKSLATLISKVGYFQSQLCPI